jgi:hypothetical protein
MKKLATIVFLVCSSLFANVSSTAQWELRTTGNDNNGGFFNGAGSSPGTDFSQQNAAQYTFADLASSNATTTCVVTSASHNFVAADNRNALHISAGTNWTTGWYEIISVAANAATLDRACGTAASVSAGTYFVGGGIATVPGMGVALSNTESSQLAGTLIGQVNVQSGTYTLTGSSTIQASTFWQCYNVTHGDQVGTCTITTATNSIDLFHLQGTGGNMSTAFDSFIFTNTAGTPAIAIASNGGGNSAYLGVRNSSFSGFTNAINGDNTGAHFLFAVVDLVGVEIKNSTGVGVINTDAIWCTACYVHNNTGTGLQSNGTAANGNSVNVNNSIISANGGKGIDAHGPFLCIDSDIANNTGDGVGSTGSAAVFSSVNCVIYGNGGFGINAVTGSGSLAPFNISRLNAYGANTSGPRSNFNAGIGDISLTASPFTSATNFALNSTAGGGAAINIQGYPGTFPGGLTTGVMAVGAVQNSTGGGGGASGGGYIIYIK